MESRPCSKVGHLGRGWSDSAMVLGKLTVPGCPTVWLIVGQWPIALAVGWDGGCLDIFIHFYSFSKLEKILLLI